MNYLYGLNVDFMWIFQEVQVDWGDLGRAAKMKERGESGLGEIIRQLSSWAIIGQLYS